MEFEISHIKYTVSIVRKHNKNTYVRIKPGFVIMVTTGPFTTKRQILKLLEDNKMSLEKMANSCQKLVKDEHKIYFFGREYDIMVMLDSKELTIVHNTICASSEKKINDWYRKEVFKIYQERLDYWYSIMNENIPYPKLKIRMMQTRWGVCNKRDNSVTLNIKLMQYSKEKLDYVIIHELSHFVHFDHSSSFWEVVRKYCPDYKKIRKDLRG